MSFDILFQRFDGGSSADSDDAAVDHLLRPLLGKRDAGYAKIHTADGSADVYGIDEPASGLMINHASGRHVWDVMFDLARAGRYVVMPTGCGTCITDAAEATNLPPGVPAPIVIVRSGGDLLQAVERA